MFTAGEMFWTLDSYEIAHYCIYACIIQSKDLLLNATIIIIDQYRLLA